MLQFNYTKIQPCHGKWFGLVPAPSAHRRVPHVVVFGYLLGEFIKPKKVLTRTAAPCVCRGFPSRPGGFQGSKGKPRLIAGASGHGRCSCSFLGEPFQGPGSRGSRGLNKQRLCF